MLTLEGRSSPDDDSSVDAATGQVMTPAAPTHSTDKPRRREIWRDPPRVVVTTPRLDNRSDWQRDPTDTLALFESRVRDGLPGVPHALCLKAPANGSGPGTWSDQWTGLSAAQRDAIVSFIAERRGLGLDTILNTCPDEPVMPMLTNWSNWAYAYNGAGFMLDSTASRLHLAQELSKKIASHTRGQIATGKAPRHTTALRVGVEGWPDDDYEGVAMMNWAKVERKAADHAWSRRQDRRARRRYLLTRAGGTRDEIPIDTARAYIARGYGLWVLNPTAELKALIVEAFAVPS